MNLAYDTLPLGELCEILDNLRKPITKKDRTAGKYPYYGATGILDYVNGYIFDEPLVLIGEDGAKWGRGDRSAFTAAGKYWVNNHAHVLRPKRAQVLDAWLTYYLNFADLTEFVSGMTVPKLNQGSLREIPIPLPPLDDQKRIVAILDEVFAGIDKAIANTELNLANAKALFESYLNSVFANPGENWEEALLSDLATDITDGDHMPPPKSPTGIPFITISDIQKDTNRIDFSDTFLVSPEYFENLKANRKPVPGDVLYTVTGSFGIPVLIENNQPFCFQRHIGLIRPKESLIPKLLYYWAKSHQAIKQANETATGTAQKTVSLKALRNFIIPRIPIPDQIRIVTKFDALSAETKKLEAIYQQKLADLAELKQSILQKAFTGELTAKPERVLAEVGV